MFHPTIQLWRLISTEKPLLCHQKLKLISRLLNKTKKKWIYSLTIQHLTWSFNFRAFFNFSWWISNENNGIFEGIYFKSQSNCTFIRRNASIYPGITWNYRKTKKNDSKAFNSISSRNNSLVVSFCPLFHSWKSSIKHKMQLFFVNKFYSEIFVFCEKQEFGLIAVYSHLFILNTSKSNKS